MGSQKNINYAGGIVGVACENAVIRYCTNGNEGAVNGVQGVGGIVGMMYADVTFEQCTNWGTISVGSNTCCMGVGGIAGYSDNAIQISYCYNYADIEYYDSDGAMGGLIGSCNNDITAVGCYSAASAEPHNAPRGLEGKTLSGNNYGDLFGNTSSYELERMLIYCDQFGANNNISDEDFDEAQISKSNYMSPQEMVEYLNGDDGAIYTADSDITGGWPVLAWELKTPTVVTNPEEAAYAKAENDFKAAKTAALDKLKNDFSFMSYAPVLFISALTGQRTERLFELINFVNDQSAMRITTGMLNNVLADAQARVQPPTDKGRRLKIYYMTQTGVKPPCFVVFCNSRELFHFSYQRYLENQIRAVFGLEGTPIRMVIRQKGEQE